MVKMDHSEAMRLQAAEKYVLGELSSSQQEEYEEHYFDCGECALDVKCIAAFADTCREVLKEEAEEARERAGVVAARGGWFAWLRPAFAVPAITALLLFVVYQNAVTIPAARQTAIQGAAQVFTAPISLQMANVRGGEEVKVQIHAQDNLPLRFDFTPRQNFEQYVCQLLEESGKTVFQVNLPGSYANKEVNLAIPAGALKAGKYALVFWGAPAAAGQPKREEVLRLAFSVEILP
jgi:hypothetical protein